MTIRHVKRYCSDFTKIENYEDAISSNERYDCHHRLEIMPWSGKQVSVEYLKEQELYYNQPAEALVFLTCKEHTSLHMKGQSKSEQQKQKMSSAQKGKPKTEEHKKHLAIAFSSGKTQSRGSKWYNNGVINKRLYEDQLIPNGFVKGRLKKEK